MPAPARASRLPLLLGAVYVLYWAALAVAPASRAVWWAENLPALAVFAGLALTWRRFAFSNAAYGLMAAWLFLHTLGGHFTFALVPFGLITDLFGFSRNHFDRLAHFCLGFYAFAAAELLERKGWAVRPAAALFGLALIMAVAAGYEIIEWWYAVLAGGQAGADFLGSQGDPWDAQADMLADTLGALAALAGYLCWPRARRLGA
jgi:putative membrane protein